jgi:hypothetical protein
MARNLVAMTDASEAEFAAGERAVGDLLMKWVVGAFGLAFFGVLATGWPLWGQVVALAALATVAAVLRLAWVRQLPPPRPAPDVPPFERLTPRPSRRRPPRPPAT